MTKFNDFLNEQLKDPEIKEEYDALEPEFAIIQALIDARKQRGITQKELSERTGISQGDISKLENMKITTDDSDTIYSFTLPGETASYYFSRIIEQASMNTEELKHVTGSVDSLKMKCRLNKKGVLTEQSASASGTVSKSIFTIPVTLTETTSFMIP